MKHVRDLGPHQSYRPKDSKPGKCNSKKVVKHYLLSTPIGRDANLHCYLMTANKKDTIHMGKFLLLEAVKMTGRMMPTILVTPLTEDGIRLVRSIILTHEEVKRALQEATDFHFSVFHTPENAAVMALH